MNKPLLNSIWRARGREPALHVGILFGLAAVAFCVLCLSARAQSTAFTYQGALDENGGPVSGVYDLRFAIHDAETNGTPLVVVTNNATEVKDGLFTVTLDPGEGVFDGNERWLEIGVVTNGGGAFIPLSPRQPITATPHAVWAANANLAGSATSAETVTGAVQASQLVGTLSTNNIADGTIVSSMIADGAVGTQNLADEAVTGEKIASNLQEGTEDLLDGFDAAFVIEDPAGGGLRIAGQLSYEVFFAPSFAEIPAVETDVESSSLVDLTAEGFRVERPITDSGLFLDGRLPRAAIVGGRPVLAFTHQDPETDVISLRFARGLDASGTGFAAPVVVDADNGFAAELAVVGGNPAVAYLRFFTVGGTNFTEILYATATDDSGSSWTSPVPIAPAFASPDGAQPPSLVEVQGRPAIAYNAADSGELFYVRALDAAGQSWGTPVLISSPGLIQPHLLVIDGQPAMAFADRNTSQLMYVRATDAEGTSWPAPIAADASSGFLTPGSIVSFAMINGHPAMGYLLVGFSQSVVGFVRAQDPQGSTWGPRQVVHAGQPDQRFGFAIHLGLIGDRPTLLFTEDKPNSLDGNLLMSVADDADASMWLPAVTLNKDQVPSQLSEDQTVTIVDAAGAPGLAFLGRAFQRNLVAFVRLPTDPFRWSAFAPDEAYPIVARVAHVADSVADRSIVAEHYALGVDTGGTPEFAEADFSEMDQGRLLISGSFDEAFTRPPTVDFEDPAIEMISTSETGFTAAVTLAPVVVDGANDPGAFVSLSERDGLPMAAYYESSAGDLRFTRALDASGTQWADPVVIDNGDQAGRFVSLALIEGHPAVAYYRANGGTQDLLYRRALDPDGTTWGAPVVLQSGEVFDANLVVDREIALLEVAGAPAVCFAEPPRVFYRRASDATGTSWPPAVEVVLTSVPAENGPKGLSMALVSGRPAIGYTIRIGAGAGNLRYVRASDATGSSWGSPVMVEQGEVTVTERLISFVPFVLADVERRISYEAPTRLIVAGGLPHLSCRRTVRETRLDTGATLLNSRSVSVFAALEPTGQLWGSSLPPLGGAGGPPSDLAAVGGDGRAIVFVDAGSVHFEFSTLSQPNGIVSGAIPALPGASLDGGLSLCPVTDGVGLLYRDSSNQNLNFLRIPVAFGAFTAWDDSVAPITAARSLQVADGSISAASLQAGSVDTATLRDRSVTLEKLNLGGEPNQVLSSTGEGLAWVAHDLELSGDTLSLRAGDTVDLGANFLRRNQSTSYDTGTLQFAPGTQLDLEGVISIGGPGQADNDILKFDGLDETFFWNNAQSRFEVTDDFLATGDITAAGHLLSSEQAFSYNLPGNTLQVRDDGETYARSTTGYIYQDTGTATLSVFGEVNLPQGAVITGGSFFYYDNSANDFSNVSGRLRRRAFASTSAENIFVFEETLSPGGSSTSVRSVGHANLASTRATVNNNLFQYWVYAEVSAPIPGDSNLRIYGFRITYTLQELLP